MSVEQQPYDPKGKENMESEYFSPYRGDGKLVRIQQSGLEIIANRFSMALCV